MKHSDLRKKVLKLMLARDRAGIDTSVASMARALAARDRDVERIIDDFETHGLAEVERYLGGATHAELTTRGLRVAEGDLEDKHEPSTVHIHRAMAVQVGDHGRQYVVQDVDVDDDLDNEEDDLEDEDGDVEDEEDDLEDEG